MIQKAPVMRYDALREDDLLARWVDGDEGAFEALFDRLGDRIFAFIARFLGDHHRAEDVYQQVLVKVATKASSYQRKSGLASWIYQIARNACLDELRSAKRRSAVSLDAPLSGDEDGAASVDLLEAGDAAVSRQVSDAELGAAIAEAVERLPDEQREVFLLKEEAGLTFEEIGDMLGCGKETAKSRMRYALRKLQNALSREARQHGLE